MSASLHRLAVLLLIARPALAQLRLEPTLAVEHAPSAAFPWSPAALAGSPVAAPAPLAPALPFIEAAAAAPIRELSLAAAPASRAAIGDLDLAARTVEPRDGAGSSTLSLNAFWDGLAQKATAPAPSPTGSSAPWLALKNSKFAAPLDAAVRLARSTRAGRRAFTAAEKTFHASRKTLPVDVRDLGRNYGEFDYTSGRLRLDRKLFRPGRETDLAGTLAHELLHVAQHAEGVPSNALEIEIEAHLLDLELLAELGVRPSPDTFTRQAYDALRKGPKEFVALIENAVPGGPFLGRDSFEEIEDQMEDDLEAAQARRGPRAARLAQAISADLKLIRSPNGRSSYREFSRRVLAQLRTRTAEAKN